LEFGKTASIGDTI